MVEWWAVGVVAQVTWSPVHMAAHSWAWDQQFDTLPLQQLEKLWAPGQGIHSCWQSSFSSTPKPTDKNTKETTANLRGVCALTLHSHACTIVPLQVRAGQLALPQVAHAGRVDVQSWRALGSLPLTAACQAPASHAASRQMQMQPWSLLAGPHRAASFSTQQEQAACFGHGYWDWLPCGPLEKVHISTSRSGKCSAPAPVAMPWCQSPTAHIPLSTCLWQGTVPPWQIGGGRRVWVKPSAITHWW